MEMSELKDSFRWAALDVQAGELSQAVPRLASDLARFEGNATVALIAGVLTVPRYQSQTLRLELLIMLALMHCGGTTKPELADMDRWFSAIGESKCVLGEDPAEDVFVDVVHLGEASYRILPGLWEAAAFQTQRIVDVVATMSDKPGYERLKREVHALLILSDIVCGRAGLRRYQAGSCSKYSELDSETMPSGVDLAGRAMLSNRELEEAGIKREWLQPFVASTRILDALPQEELGSTSLERYPLIEADDEILVSLPTAISVALRSHVLNYVLSNGHAPTFDRILAQQFALLIGQTHLFGSASDVPVKWEKVGEEQLAGVAFEFDVGHFLVLHFFLPSVAIHSDAGFKNARAISVPALDAINGSMKRLGDTLSLQPEFRGGIHVVVGCGWGAGSYLQLPWVADGRWKVTSLSASDLVLLSRAEGMSSKKFWRLQEALDDLPAFGVHLANANGVLNLYAWVQGNGGQLIPHDKLPSSRVSPESPLLLVMPSHLLQGVRTDVAHRHDRHICRDLRGSLHQMQRVERDLFKVAGNEHLFSCIQCARDGKLITAYEGVRWLWIFLEAPQLNDVYYRLWEMVTVWLPRIGQVLDGEFAGGHALELTLWFEDDEAYLRSSDAPKSEPPSNLITIEIVSPSSARVTFAHGFMGWFRDATNIAERSVVRSALEAFLRLTGTEAARERANTLLQKVVPNQFGRSFHLFYARSYADHVREHLAAELLRANEIDLARLRLGLGWRAHHEDNFIVGSEASGAFLHTLVDVVVKDTLDELALLDREATILRLLLNHERANADQEAWKLTAAAVLGLYGRTAATLEPPIKALSENSETKVLSRCLVEMAICACPLNGGRPPADVDLERLISRLSLLVQLGSISDGIYYGVLEPYLRISGLGDVMIADKLGNDVVEPMLTQAIGRSYVDGAPRKGPSYEIPELIERSVGAFNPEFWEAWTVEMGFDIDDGRAMLDRLENEALKRGVLVLDLRLNEATHLLAEVATMEGAQQFIKRLSLHPRDRWEVPPKGYKTAEILPWRFGRRLSLISQPIVQLDLGSNPRLLVSPSLVRGGFAHLVSAAYEGTFRDDFFKSDALRKWRQKVQEGHSFNAEVAIALRTAGWEVRENIALPELLHRKLDADYGDVDVLAWRRDSPTVLVVECKDLKSCRSYSEIAAQLSDYKGEFKRGEKDKLLKHLTRFELIRKEPEVVARLTGSVTMQVKSCLVASDLVPMSFSKMPALAGTFVGDVETLIEHHNPRVGGEDPSHG